jgi:hexosaminidase
VESHYPRLTALGIQYGFDKQAITFSIQSNPISKSFQVELIPAQTDLKILYTLDQSLPQIGNPKAIHYDKAIELEQSGILKAAIQQADTNQLEVFSRQFDIHQAIAKPCSLKVKPSDSYAANGANSLVDGLIGSIDFHDGLWLGFQQNNLEAIIDLGENQKVNKIQAHFLQSMPSWILFPESVSLYTSIDGIQFKLYKVIENKFPQNVSETSMQNFTFDLSNTATRYIKVIAKKVDKCPEWHEAAGSEAWLFVDEISIY